MKKTLFVSTICLLFVLASVSYAFEWPWQKWARLEKEKIDNENNITKTEINKINLALEALYKKQAEAGVSYEFCDRQESERYAKAGARVAKEDLRNIRQYADIDPQINDLLEKKHSYYKKLKISPAELNKFKTEEKIKELNLELNKTGYIYAKGVEIYNYWVTSYNASNWVGGPPAALLEQIEKDKMVCDTLERKIERLQD